MLCTSSEQRQQCAPALLRCSHTSTIHWCCDESLRSMCARRTSTGIIGKQSGAVHASSAPGGARMLMLAGPMPPSSVTTLSSDTPLVEEPRTGLLEGLRLLPLELLLPRCCGHSGVLSSAGMAVLPSLSCLSLPDVEVSDTRAGLVWPVAGLWPCCRWCGWNWSCGEAVPGAAAEADGPPGRMLVPPEGQRVGCGEVPCAALLQEGTCMRSKRCSIHCDALASMQFAEVVDQCWAHAPGATMRRMGQCEVAVCPPEASLLWSCCCRSSRILLGRFISDVGVACAP